MVRGGGIGGNGDGVSNAREPSYGCKIGRERGSGAGEEELLYNGILRRETFVRRVRRLGVGQPRS